MPLGSKSSASREAAVRWSLPPAGLCSERQQHAGSSGSTVLGKGFVLSPAAAKMAAQGGSLVPAVALKLYPNPVADFVTLQSGAPVSGTVVLYDVGGRRVLRQAVSAVGSARLDVRDLPAGVYLLELQTVMGKTTQKLVVQTQTREKFEWLEPAWRRLRVLPPARSDLADTPDLTSII